MRSTVISKEGAAIRVERLNLTDRERESLSVNVRLSDIPMKKDLHAQTTEKHPYLYGWIRRKELKKRELLKENTELRCKLERIKECLEMAECGEGVEVNIKRLFREEFPDDMPPPWTR